MYRNIGISNDPAVGMANPSSVYCGQQGGISEIRTDSNQNQWGVCKFKDGTECEEWDYYGKKCLPGQCKKIDKNKIGEIVCLKKGTVDKSNWIIGGMVALFTVFVGGVYIASK